MSRFSKDVYGSDRANQAVAVLGGATAPAYEAVSLLNAEYMLEPNLGVLLSELESLNENPARSADTDSGLVSEKTMIEAADSQLRSTNILNGFGDESIGVDDVQVREVLQDVNLLTRFQMPDADNVASLSARPDEPRVGADSGGELAALSSGPTALSSFLEQLVAKVEGASADFSSEFDGSTQGAVRELILEIGSDLSTSVRTELQDNVAGVGRELAAQAIDRVGIDPLETAVEPLLSFDYYGESAVVINGLIDNIGQPIGSIALPQVGPFIADLKGELAGFVA